MHLRTEFLFLSFLLGAIGIALAAQENAIVFRADSRLVVLHATVADKHGKLVTDLPQTAFHIYEDGVEQRLKVFRREDVPVSMGIVIDNSGSMQDKRKNVEDAAMALVEASNPQDEVFIVNFDDQAFLDVDFTNDIEKLRGGVARIDSRGGTAMRDAINLSLDHLREKGKWDKKVLVVITDGNDNTSEISLEDLVQKSQQREVLIYALGLLDEEEAEEARHGMDALTTATGGQAFYPKKAREVGKLTLQVAHDLRSQYTIAYTPANEALDGGFRQIRVTAEGPNDPTVRTRTGYYATPELATQAAGSAAVSGRPAD